MADGQAPDQTQALLQMQSMIAAAAGNGAKGLPMFAGILPGGGKPIDVGASLSLKGKAFNTDGMVNKLPQGKPRAADKLFNVVASLGEDFKKMAQSAGVMYTGDLPTGTPISSGGGGSFAGNSGA